MTVSIFGGVLEMLGLASKSLGLWCYIPYLNPPKQEQMFFSDYGVGIETSNITHHLVGLFGKFWIQCQVWRLGIALLDSALSKHLAILLLVFSL